MTGSILIEFVIYEGEGDSIELGVYGLHSDGQINIVRVDDFTTLKKQLKAFRQTRSPIFGKMLYTKLLQDVLGEPGEYSHIFISPDGLLNLIPFEILQDADGEMYSTKPMSVIFQPVEI